MKYIKIENIIFRGKRNIDWDGVENYLMKYSGKSYVVKDTDDVILINSVSADEFANSEYTKNLKGAYAKVKANMATKIPELIANATNRRWSENKSEKHKNNASKGWYRYDIGVQIPVMGIGESEKRWNKYRATLVVRYNDNGLLLYDVINIKKEASTPSES